MLRWTGYPLPHHLEVGEGKEQLQFEVVHADTSVEALPESDLTFDVPKGMVHFGAERGFRRLNQIQKPALWCLWKSYGLAGLQGNLELSYGSPGNPHESRRVAPGNCSPKAPQIRT